MNNTVSGSVVLDLFGGSGTTLIACEQVGRVCYTMELDPKYTDVIVKRYLNLTGNEEGAYLIRDGKRERLASAMERVSG